MTTVYALIIVGMFGGNIPPTITVLSHSATLAECQDNARTMAGALTVGSPYIRFACLPSVK